MAECAAPERVPAQVRQLLADVFAGGLACIPALDQPAAGAEHERLYVRHLTAEHIRHFGVGEVAGLGEEQRRALVLGQVKKVAEQLAQLGAALDLLGQALSPEVEVKRGVFAARPQRRQAAVAGDRVQPGLQRQAALPAPSEVAKRRHERVLHRVLRLLGRTDHVAAEAK
jgi:hypothetical protein